MSSILPGADEVDILRLMGFEAAFIRAVKEYAGERLLPVQRRAMEAGLFEGRNLVVMSPTASGKGLVGELACLREAQENRRSMFLVPTRALATEKYEHFRRAYGSLGVRPAVSSSDHRRFDESILSGDYQIAVIVYEKVRSLLVQRPDLMDEVGVVVVDELQNLFDEERGAGLEFLLTSIRDTGLQLIGLSAALGNREVADWLGAELVVETQRPVELRQGVLSSGIFRYREYNSQEEGEEAFVRVREESERATLCQTAVFLAESQGESVLVFVATRDETFALASELARVSTLAPAGDALQELDLLEPTATAAFLRETLARGIAVHNSDLTAEERRLVERAVRGGEARIICATTTLSEGVNLPVTNTFVPRRVYRGPVRPYEGYGRGPDPVPLSRCEFQNMTGRSGRPAPDGGPAFGRGVMVAAAGADAAGLFRDYVDGAIERLPASQFASGLDSLVLEFLARNGPSAEEHLVSVFAGSLSGVARPREEMERRVRGALENLDVFGLVDQRAGKWEANPSGRLIGMHGLRVESGVLFQGFLEESDPDRLSALDVLLLTALAADGEAVRIPVGRTEWRKGMLEREFLRLVDEGEISDWVARTAGHAPETGSIRFSHRTATALNKSLLLRDYAGGIPSAGLEERYRLRLGLIQRAAERTAWLLRALAEMAHFHGWPVSDRERIAELAESVRWGLPKGAFGLVELLEAGLPRSHVLALAEAGLDGAAKLESATESVLASVIPRKQLRFLVQWRQTKQEGRGEEEGGIGGDHQAHRLVIDADRPDRMIYCGVEVPLTGIQFRLMEVLWRNRGRCVSYDDIMRYVWRGSVVEQNNVLDQKSRILKKLNVLVGKQATPLVRTIRGQGLLLERK